MEVKAEREYKRLEKAVKKRIKSLDSSSLIDLLSRGVCFDPNGTGNYLNPNISLRVQEELEDFMDQDSYFLPGVVNILVEIFGAELTIVSKKKE